MRNLLVEEFRFIRARLRPESKWIMRTVAGFTFIAFVRDEFFPEFSKYRGARFMPDWTWHTWLITALVIFLLIMVKLVYQLHQEETYRNKPLFDAFNNPINYRIAPKLHPSDVVLALLIVIAIGSAYFYNVKNQLRPFRSERTMIESKNMTIIPSAEDELRTQVRVQLLPALYPDTNDITINRLLVSFDNGGSTIDREVSLHMPLPFILGTECQTRIRVIGGGSRGDTFIHLLATALVPEERETCTIDIMNPLKISTVSLWKQTYGQPRWWSENSKYLLLFIYRVEWNSKEGSVLI